MTYSCKYRNNPTFPYTKRTVSKKQPSKSNTTNNSCIKEQAPCNSKEEETKKEPFSFLNSSFLHSILEPIEKLLGRKISVDDILLLVLIYILFTEKESENDNKTLILCLLFILFG